MKAVFDLNYKVIGIEPCSWSVYDSGICGLRVNALLKTERWRKTGQKERQETRADKGEKKENIKREHRKTKTKQKEGGGGKKIKRRQGEDINEKADQ